MKIQKIIPYQIFTGEPQTLYMKCNKDVLPQLKSVDYIFSKKNEIEPLLPKDYYNKTAMHIYLLESLKAGQGREVVKHIVKESLTDVVTEGRVSLVAASIDNRTCPIGFYYKLGFRSVYDVQNEACEIWLKNGGKKNDAPWIDYAYMYLPKENIQQCLNYPEKLNVLC